tara:strand:- start:27229 stop:27471 length:243 start_codon:yes stop_codon:yes gene_type:complete
MNKSLEFLNQVLIELTKKVESIERWCVKHEAEGIEYGNEFEDRDNQLYDKITDLSERINIIGDAVIALNERLSHQPGEIR